MVGVVTSLHWRRGREVRGGRDCFARYNNQANVEVTRQRQRDKDDDKKTIMRLQQQDMGNMGGGVP
jgi:hypothetical protein